MRTPPSKTSISKLDRLKPSLRNPDGIATLVSVSAKRTSFRVTARSRLTGDTFSIVWTNSGKVHRHCTGAAPACCTAAGRRGMLTRPSRVAASAGVPARRRSA